MDCWWLFEQEREREREDRERERRQREREKTEKEREDGEREKEREDGEREETRRVAMNQSSCRMSTRLFWSSTKTNHHKKKEHFTCNRPQEQYMHSHLNSPVINVSAWNHDREYVCHFYPPSTN